MVSFRGLLDCPLAALLWRLAPHRPSQVVLLRPDAIDELKVVQLGVAVEVKSPDCSDEKVVVGHETASHEELFQIVNINIFRALADFVEEQFYAVVADHGELLFLVFEFSRQHELLLYQLTQELLDVVAQVLEGMDLVGLALACLSPKNVVVTGQQDLEEAGKK